MCKHFIVYAWYKCDRNNDVIRRLLQIGGGVAAAQAQWVRPDFLPVGQIAYEHLAAVLLVAAVDGPELAVERSNRPGNFTPPQVIHATDDQMGTFPAACARVKLIGAMSTTHGCGQAAMSSP